MEQLMKRLLDSVKSQIDKGEPKFLKDAYQKLLGWGFKEKESLLMLTDIFYGLIDDNIDNQIFETEYKNRLDQELKRVEKIAKQMETYRDHPERVRVMQIKASLKGYEQLVNRTVLIPEIASVAELAYTILIAMNGNGDHRYQIKHHRVYIPKKAGGDSQKEDAALTLLNSLQLKEGAILEMTYDFSENWKFELLVEKIFDISPNEKYPRVISGTGYGIIENERSLFELVAERNLSKDAMLKDPELKDFAFDIHDFQIAECQKRLETLLIAMKSKYES